MYKNCDKCLIKFKGKSIFCYNCRGIKLFPISCKKNNISVNTDLDCYILDYHSNSILFDFDDYTKIVNLKLFYVKNTKYIYLKQNGRNLSLHRYLFNNPKGNVKFLNDNKVDLRKKNMYCLI